MKKFIITEEEKKQILKMHKSNGYGLMEQVSQSFDVLIGKTYSVTPLKDKTWNDETNKTYDEMSDEEKKIIDPILNGVKTLKINGVETDQEDRLVFNMVDNMGNKYQGLYYFNNTDTLTKDNVEGLVSINNIPFAIMFDSPNLEKEILNIKS